MLSCIHYTNSNSPAVLAFGDNQTNWESNHGLQADNLQSKWSPTPLTIEPRHMFRLFKVLVYIQ